MPDTVKIRYIGHSSVGVDHPVTGETIEHGHQAEVPAEIAGAPPSGKDPGSGLLAQVDEWEPADAKKAKSEGDANDAQ